MTALLLDPNIRDWVVLPLFVIIVAAGLLRQSVGALLQGSKQKIPPLYQRGQNLSRQTIIRSGAAHYITTAKWQQRKQHYAALLEEQATWCEAEHEKRKAEQEGDDDPLSMMMNNPMGMMKGSMAFMIQNMVMMQGIQHFFSGFILLKVPFPLTLGFKSMFQRGLADLPDLESSYVSSVSWYFLVMYGLNSLFRLLIGQPPLEVVEQESLLTQLGLQNQPNPNVKQDTESVVKNLRQEAENIEIYLQQEHKSEIDSVEKRLLKRLYPKKKLGANDTADLFGSSSQRPKSKKNKAQ